MKVNIDQFNKRTEDDIFEVEVTSKDCWYLDYILAQVIHAALVKFRADLYSYSMVDDEDLPPNFSEDSEEDSENRWKYVLDEMIWGFEEIKTWGENEPMAYRSKEWADYNKRIANSTRLFGKYFQSLWN